MTYVSSPSQFAAANTSYYGTYSSQVSTSTVTGLWDAYINVYFSAATPDPRTIIYLTGTTIEQENLSTIMNTAGSWPPAQLTTFNDNALIEGMFAVLLNDFFYVYEPMHGAASPSSSTLVTDFTNYLTSLNRNPLTAKQNSVFLWIWALLTQMLTDINNATLTEGGYLLAMTNAELAAATDMASISYGTQQSDNDYGTQALNMNLQKQADVLRSQRSADGKSGQMAQSMITTLRDQATQQAQLMSSLMDNITQMYSAIMKK